MTDPQPSARDIIAAWLYKSACGEYEYDPDDGSFYADAGGILNALEFAGYRLHASPKIRTLYTGPDVLLEDIVQSEDRPDD